MAAIVSRLLDQSIASDSLTQYQGTVSNSKAIFPPPHLSFFLHVPLSFLWDWLVAAGQSKLLRLALHLAINALSSQCPSSLAVCL